MALLLTGVIIIEQTFTDTPKTIAQKVCHVLVAGGENTAIKYTPLATQQELKGHMNKFKGMFR